MRLYLMRHGPAASSHPHGDAARPLTSDGADLVRRLAQGLPHLAPRPTLLLTSNFTRARETGALVGDALGLAPEIATMIHPNSGISDLELLWDLYGRPDTWMVVGHQPALGELVRLLTYAHVAVRPGTVAAIEAPAVRLKTGTLLGLYDPHLLAALASA
ncbi:MAG: histidine phosphatase family protein [Bacteroidota bacterium]